MATAKTKSTKAPAPRLSYTEAMAELEAAGSEQTRKTWLRHGAREPMFGVNFSVLKALLKRIKVDHELAVALWDSGNHDARNLAVKIADPAALSPSDLDRWAREGDGACTNYVALLALDGPHAQLKASQWLVSEVDAERTAGWRLLGHLAMRDVSLPDAWFEPWLDTIEANIHAASNPHREAMNHALIAIGCRNEALRARASAAAVRIGPVHVDHGDTDCKTPDAATSLDTYWAYAISKGHESPAAAERGRVAMRLRC
jgi:3-methyladenine DNA glycosylase AlkD